MPLGKIFEKQDVAPKPGDGVVTAFRDGNVMLRSRRRLDGFTESLKEIGYQRVTEGDLVIHSMDAFAGAIGVAQDTGKSTPVYIVLKPKENIYPKYYSYVLRAYAQAGAIQSLTQGIRERSTDFRWSVAKTLLVPIPPYEDQKRIADELDRELAEIDEFIADLEATQLLLNEKYQLELNNLYWGEANELVPLKRFVKFVDQGSSPIADSNPAEANEIGILKAGCTAGGEFNIQANKKVIPGTPIKESTFVKEGDLLVTRASGSKNIVGSAAIVGKLDRQLALSDKIYRLHNDSPETSQYLCNIMATRQFREQLELEISGAEGLAKNISLQSLLSLKIPFPWKKFSYFRILNSNRIDNKTAIEYLGKSIDLAREKRNSILINSVVK